MCGTRSGPVAVSLVGGLKYTFVLLAFLLLSGCASKHNMQTSGPNYLGGGYDVQKINGNTYRIVVKTNFAPYENLSGARTMWEEQAKKSCGSSKYREENVKEYTYKHVPDFVIIPYIITVKLAHAICDELPLKSSSN